MDAETEQHVEQNTQHTDAPEASPAPALLDFVEARVRALTEQHAARGRQRAALKQQAAEIAERLADVEAAMLETQGRIAEAQRMLGHLRDAAPAAV